MNIQDQNVWRAISGPCDIPNVGSIVYYYPRLHQKACQGDDTTADLLLPARVTAEVLSRRFRANRDGGQDVFVEFLLQPVGDDSTARGELMGGLQPDMQVFTKSMSSEDARSPSCYIPTVIGEAIFPRLQRGVASQRVVVRDIGGREWNLKYFQSHKIGGNWTNFLEGRGVVGGTDMVMIKRGNSLTIGFKNGARPPLRQATEAAANFDRGNTLQVSYYPINGEEYVLLKEKVDAVAQVQWNTGMMVRLGEKVGTVETFEDDIYGTLLTIRFNSHTSIVRPWKVTPV